MLQNLDILRNVRLTLSEFYTEEKLGSLPYKRSSFIKYFIEKICVYCG